MKMTKEEFAEVSKVSSAPFAQDAISARQGAGLSALAAPTPLWCPLLDQNVPLHVC